MKIGYKFYRCSAQKKITAAVLVVPDGTMFVYNNKGDIDAPYSHLVVVEVKDVAELKKIIMTLIYSGLDSIELNDYLGMVADGIKVGCNAVGKSLVVGFNYSTQDYMGVIDPVNFKYGIVGIEGHTGISLDLVVTVKYSSSVTQLMDYAAYDLQFNHFFR